ncbi:MAG: T9SS type A sorting domain-containing protein [Cryomorphaceae bacterium]
MYKLLTVFSIFLATSALQGQFAVEPSVDIPVFSGNGTQLLNPWTGGMNAVQLSTFDADGDGEADDIFLFDRGGNRILVFIGDMENGERTYTYDPSYATAFPHLERWALLRDFNCDGKKDIFTYSLLGGGLAAYANTTPDGGNLGFELENELLTSRFQFNPNSAFQTNIYASSLDLPAIVDLDGDGDLDIFTFSVTGTQLEYHENLSVDSTDSCSPNLYRAANLCYGQFREGSESNEVFLGQPCNFNVLDPRSAEEITDNGGSRHVGTTLLALDGNDDGIYDLVIGGVSYSNLTFLENSVSSAGIDSIVDFQSDFPAGFGAPAVNLDNFVSSFYEDVTGNDVRDLIATVNESATARNTRSVWLYENLGTESAPIFSLATDEFLQNTTIDHGETAAPVFADVNGDGLPDMVIGSRGQFIQNSEFRPTLSLYLNTGTPSAPTFTLEDPDWLQVSEIGLGQYIHPTFGDIDGDGDSDLVIGDASGRVFLLLNTAGTGNEMSFELAGAITAEDGVIDVGQVATPQLFDLDGDGKLDLIIGERNGNINYYRNNDEPGNVSFTFETDTLGDISTIEFGFFIGSSSPHFFTHDDITYLLLGVERGRLHLYSGIDGNETGTYTADDLNAFDIETGEKARPFVIDINNDGTPDIFCGSIGGGVLHFEGTGPVSTRNESKPGSLRLYPNPAGDFINVESELISAGASYFIYDLAGKIVKSGSLNGGTAHVGNLPSGAYIIVVEQGDSRERGLWIKR